MLVGFLEVGRIEDHSLVNVGKRADLVTRDLVDLHFIESADYAFPGCAFHRFDDDHRTCELVIITDFAGFFLELLFSDLFVAPVLLILLNLLQNLLVTDVEDFADAAEHGAFVTFEVSYLDVRLTGALIIGFTGVVVDGVVFDTAFVIVGSVEDESDCFRFLGFLQFLGLELLVGGKRDREGLRLDHGGTQHEERDQKHVHVDHGGEVHMD